jgi:hypothetical protein
MLSFTQLSMTGAIDMVVGFRVKSSKPGQPVSPFRMNTQTVYRGFRTPPAWMSSDSSFNGAKLIAILQECGSGRFAVSDSFRKSSVAKP